MIKPFPAGWKVGFGWKIKEKTTLETSFAFWASSSFWSSAQAESTFCYSTSQVCDDIAVPRGPRPFTSLVDTRICVVSSLFVMLVENRSDVHRDFCDGVFATPGLEPRPAVINRVLENHKILLIIAGLDYKLHLMLVLSLVGKT